MVLLDHFRSPLSDRRHWHAFHNAWATYLATDLNRQLPEGFFAELNVQFGIEIDVAAFEEIGGAEQSLTSATAWTAPEPSQTLAFELRDEVVEIGIMGNEGGPTLNAAIELVSPANKDRPQQRAAFVSKCETYLREGVSLIVVDVVTTRWANLHQELLSKLDLGQAIAPAPPQNPELYAVAYRSYRSYRNASAASETELAIWYETFALGGQLPTLPLWLKNSVCLPLTLQRSYEETCLSQRISCN